MDIDIVSALAKGDKRTVQNVNKAVTAALQDASVINQLVLCLDENVEAPAMRAADALQKIHVQKPELIIPYTSRLFQVFLKRGQKEIRWHMAQILPSLPLTQKQQNQAVAIWKDDFYHSNSSIVRTFSMQAMYDVSKLYPVLLEDFEKMLSQALTNGTPAMKSRARKLTL